MPDGWEVRYFLDPLNNDADKDPDGDDYSNLDEFINGTNPHIYNESGITSEKPSKS